MNSNMQKPLEFQISTSELSLTAVREMEIICDEILLQKTMSVIAEDNNKENITETILKPGIPSPVHVDNNDNNDNNNDDNGATFEMIMVTILKPSVPSPFHVDNNDNNDNNDNTDNNDNDNNGNNDSNDNNDDNAAHFEMTNFSISEESIHIDDDIDPPEPIAIHRTISAVDHAIERAIEKIGAKQESKEYKKDGNTKKLFICYFFFCLYWGHLESLPGSLFNELIDQLNINEIGIGSIFVSRAIAFCVSSIVTAYVIDKFVASHRYSALIFFISLISVSLMAYIDFVYIQYILWISIGSASGLIEVGIPVYAFRAFTAENSQKIWFKLIASYNLAKTVTPLIIQISIGVFGTYSYSLFFISFIALCGSILLFILQTPEHDEFRAMKKEMAKTDTLRNAESVLKELEQHKIMRNIIIILFGMVTIMYSVIMSGLVTFITLYVTQYLGISDIIGRYLISTYYGGQFLYRFWIGFCLCSCCKKRMHSTNYLFSTLIIGYSLYAVLFAIWILFTISPVIDIDININIKIIILFIVFGFGGFASSSTYPTTFELTETIYPINGVISCIFTISLGIGDSIIVVIMSELFKYFHVGLQPIPLLIAAFIQILIVIIIIILYKKYKSYESVILASKTRQLSALQQLDDTQKLQLSISALHKNYSYI